MSDIVLILAHATDSGAAAVAAALRGWATSGLASGLASGSASVAVWEVRPESLTLAHWSHGIDEHGQASTHIALPERPALASAQIRAVLNRVQYLPVAQFLQAQTKDRDYAQAEFQALIVSWLGACGDRVIHSLHIDPALPQQLSFLRWCTAAVQCGLPLARAIQSPALVWDTTILVAGSRTSSSTGHLAARFAQACVATAHLLGFALLEFCFNCQDGEFTLVAVNLHPLLRTASDIHATTHLIAEVAGLGK